MRLVGFSCPVVSPGPNAVGGLPVGRRQSDVDALHAAPDVWDITALSMHWREQAGGGALLSLS